MSNLANNESGMSERGYRLDRQNAKLFGVCSGLENATNVDAIWWRLGLVGATLLGFGLVIPLYVAVALIAD